MKAFFLLFVFAFAAADEEYYVLQKVNLSDSSKIDEIMKNLMSCFLDRSPCSEAFDSYKNRIPEAFQQACKKCTTEQKRFAAQFLESLKDKFPKDYDDFIKKYDPDNKYFEALKAEVNKYL